MELAFGRTMLMNTDAILLDEPINFLNIVAITLFGEVSVGSREFLFDHFLSRF